VIISSNAKGVAPLFCSFEYNAKGNARTMHSSHGRFIKSSATQNRLKNWAFIRSWSGMDPCQSKDAAQKMSR
jgi:hypothetical protein